VVQPAANSPRSAALKISLTLPVLPEGIDANGFAVLKSARDNGISLDMVNVRAMDYNRASGNYGDFAVQVAQSTFNQIKSLWMLSFWEMTRDRNACNGSLVACTNVRQTPYQFSQIFGNQSRGEIRWTGIAAPPTLGSN
jgi:hypothetical protein